MVSQKEHRCDIGDLDYSQVLDGKIVCTECNRIWRLHGTYWWPHPCPGCNKPPEQCRHYGKRKYKK